MASESLTEARKEALLALVQLITHIRKFGAAQSLPIDTNEPRGLSTETSRLATVLLGRVRAFVTLATELGLITEVGEGVGIDVPILPPKHLLDIRPPRSQTVRTALIDMAVVEPSLSDSTSDSTPFHQAPSSENGPTPCLPCGDGTVHAAYGRPRQDSVASFTSGTTSDSSSTHSSIESRSSASTVSLDEDHLSTAHGALYGSVAVLIGRIHSHSHGPSVASEGQLIDATREVVQQVHTFITHVDAILEASIAGEERVALRAARSNLLGTTSRLIDAVRSIQSLTTISPRRVREIDGVESALTAKAIRLKEAIAILSASSECIGAAAACVSQVEELIPPTPREPSVAILSPSTENLLTAAISVSQSVILEKFDD